jgi:hypothetical protein
MEAVQNSVDENDVKDVGFFNDSFLETKFILYTVWSSQVTVNDDKK